MRTAGQAPLPRRRVLTAGALGITSTALPVGTAAASPLALTADTAVASVTATATEAGTLTASWDGPAAFTYDLTLQRTGGEPETLPGVTSPVTVTPSDWTAADDAIVYTVYVTSRSGDTALNSAPSNVTLDAAATGGTVTTFTGDGTNGAAGVTYRVHTFTAEGTLTVAHGRSAEYLLVGGGGGGGTRHGGGGGGGGVRTGATSLSPGSETIVVGAGGVGMSRPDQQSGSGTSGTSGGDTTAFVITAAGGGRGGGSLHGPSGGGSGGGSHSSGTAAGTGTSGQGDDGGDGVSGTGEGGFAGGGGGGAGAPGGDATGGGTVDGVAGDGGAGVESTITGATVRYGAGGGGSLSPRATTGTAGAAGDGGGGAGGSFGWTLYDASAAAPTLAWELLTTSGSNPGNGTEFNLMIENATPLRSGRAGLTSQSSASTLSANVLNWTTDTELENVLGTGNVVSDNFALVVTGTFIPLESGTYWFTLESDDSADLRIGATTVAWFYGGRGRDPLGTTTGSILLTAGTAYAFRARMQEGSVDAGLQVFWQRPTERADSTTVWRQHADELPGTSPNTEEDMDRTIAGATVAARGLAAVTTGAHGVDAGTNVLNWSSAAELATATGATVPNAGSSFALVVAGTFVPSETGTYTFTISGDDAIDLAIDGTVVAAHYGAHPPADVGVRTVGAALTRGVPVRLEVRTHQAAGGTATRVFWRRPSQTTGWHHDAGELAATGRAGTDGLGGGGGAGGFIDQSNADGGAGGDGVVIVRYRHDAA